MKKTILSLVMGILTASLVFSQTETRNLGNFNGVSASTGVKVILKKSSETKAIIVTQNCEPSEVSTEIEGGTLKVKFKKSGWRVVKNRRATVTVHYKNLEQLDVSSGANISSENIIVARELDVNASSGGSLSTRVEAGRLDVDVSSGGEVELSGQADAQNIDVSSGGVYKGHDLKSKSANADASSGGVARIWVTEALIADASSGGAIDYKGKPSSVNVDASISGAVRSSN